MEQSGIKQDVEHKFSKLITHVIKIFNVDLIVLFGSRARMEALPHSDYDLMIVANFDKPYIERATAMLKYLPFGVAFDLFCYTREEFLEMYTLKKIHIMDALNNGISIHESDFFRNFRGKK